MAFLDAFPVTSLQESDNIGQVIDITPENQDVPEDVPENVPESDEKS